MRPFILSKTGNILATFEPTDARVSLDQNLESRSSPTRIRSIFPGAHEITISHDGFIPYTRTIRIEPQQTAFINDVFLLKNDPAIHMSGELPLTQTVSPMLAVTEKKAHLETDLQMGTRIFVDGIPVSRDLGTGVWKLVGGDKNIFGLTHGDSNEIQFRAWDKPDAIITTLPGNELVIYTFRGSRALLAVSNFEIWNFDTDKKSAELIYRFSNPILHVRTVPNTPIILARLSNRITAFYIGDHHYIPTILIDTPSITDETISVDGRTLFFTTPAGNMRKPLY